MIAPAYQMYPIMRLDLSVGGSHSDVKRKLSSALGILDPTEGVAMRATFVVDPKNTIRFVSVTDLDVGRNPHEVLRVLDALQTGALTPCNWQRGEPTLTA